MPPGTIVSPGALLELLHARRSIRRFRPDPVPEEMIALLVEAARCAPSAGNRQAWRLIVVRTPGCIAEMAAIVRNEAALMRERVRTQATDPGAYFSNLHHFDGAPVVLAPFHRVGVSLSEAVQAGRIPGPPIEAESVASVAAAIQNLLLCAHALGLGTCWMTGPLVAAEALAPLLGIPAGWALSALVPVGFPAETPAAPPRRPLTQIGEVRTSPAAQGTRAVEKARAVFLHVARCALGGRNEGEIVLELRQRTRRV